MNKRGFTLIELMVSVTIFIIVMTVALGALLAMSASDRRAQSVKTVMNNLSFALESMTRTIRTGYDYHCNSSSGGDCTSGSGGYAFYFTSAASQSVSYCLGTGTTCGTSTVCAAGCSILRSTNGGSTYQSMTAPEVKIYNMSFYLQGSLTTDDVQPRVTITLDGAALTADVTPATFQVQTSVTQRLYDQ
ncbi:MAG: type II secretion system protein [Candidatus Pacebacteria bacterium]|nr:type II secretion system protein [Candidatus Paceibacterota bacterium]